MLLQSRLARIAPVASLALAALFVAPAAQAADTTALSLSKPWIRFIIPARPAGGYFVLKNSGAVARTLVGASSPGCGTLMLHKSETKSGADTMVMVPSVQVPAHGSLAFAPGGYHLMCMQPAKTLRPGSSVPVTLKFKDGASLTVAFPVRNAAGK